MYRVLIVDDEEPVLESYSFLIDGYRQKFFVVEVARNGYDALRLIGEIRPDIVFMDINIPGMDGIEVIETIYRKVPNTVFILSTAYERFDIAKRAIPLQVFAYLVKPVSKINLLSCLDSVAVHIDSKRPKTDAADAKNLALRQFLTESIWKPMEEADWIGYKNLFDFKNDLAAVLMLEGEEDLEKLATDLYTRLDYRYQSFYILENNRIVFLIIADKQDSDAQSYVAATLDELGDKTVGLSWAMGGFHKGSSLSLSCREALDQLRLKKTSLEALRHERFRLVQIRKKIGLAQADSIVALIHLHCQEVLSSFDLEEAKAKMLLLFALVLDDIGGYYQGKTEAPPPLLLSQEIPPIDNLGALQRWVHSAIDVVARLLETRQSKNLPLPLTRALEYVQIHFTQPIQLYDVAEAAQVSPAYLSRLFSEHVSGSFVDYVTELRIERAEELLRESNLSVKEIALKTGIADANYFSKVFRKATGLSPSAYALKKENEQ